VDSDFLLKTKKKTIALQITIIRKKVRIFFEKIISNLHQPFIVAFDENRHYIIINV